VRATAGRRRDQRRFVSLGVLLFGLALPVTGVADHMARHDSGPQADPGWIAVHIVVGAVFVALAGWHAWLNRRALLRYVRGQ
jgi:hypothetical protein